MWPSCLYYFRQESPLVTAVGNINRNFKSAFVDPNHITDLGIEYHYVILRV